MVVSGCLEGVWKLSGGCLAGFWWLSGGCLKGVRKESGGCLKGVWRVPQRCLEGIYEMSEWYVRCLDVSFGAYAPKINPPSAQLAVMSVMQHETCLNSFQNSLNHPWNS